MRRKRLVSPEMFTSLAVAAWPTPTRWTWVGLLCYLDDHGYGIDNASLIKASVWPLDDTYTAKKVAADLDRIGATGSVCRFSCCGRSQLHAPEWTKWQKVPHPKDTNCCPCPDHAPDAAHLHADFMRAS